MKFVFYCYAVSLMSGGAWQQFSKIRQHFWLKINILEISSHKPVTLIVSDIFQNHWWNCKFCTPSSTMNRGVLHLDERTCFELWRLRLGLFTITSGLINFYAWLLLFEVLHETSEILSLRLVSCRICCTTLCANSITVNYSGEKCLSVPEIYSANKSSAI